MVRGHRYPAEGGDEEGRVGTARQEEELGEASGLTVHEVDWETATRPYPFRVRPHPLETLDSFSRRTLEANFEDTGDARFLVNLAGGAERTDWETILLAKTRQPRALFQHPTPRELSHRDGTTCELCSPGTGNQWACRLCVAGEAIELAPHLERLVCIRHGIWVGSGYPTVDQPRVSERYVEAERRFQKLRRRGVVDAWSLWELLHTVAPGKQSIADRSVLPPSPFPLAVDLWRLLTNPDFTTALLRQPTYRAAFELLAAAVLELTTELGIAQRVWHLIRPAVLRARQPGGDNQPAPMHEFRLGVAVTDLSAAAPLRPGSYLLASRTRLTRHTWRGLVVPRNAGLPTHKAVDVDALCLEGHWLPRSYCDCVRELGSEFRCCICQGR